MKSYVGGFAPLLVALWVQSTCASEIIVNQSANSLGYDSLSNQIYASVPFSAASNANSLMPIDSVSGALGTPIPIGTRLGQIAVSSDSSFVYVVDNDGHGVQRYNVTNNSLDQNFNMPGTGEFFQSVRQMYAVPGQPASLLIERGLVNFSPPAVATGVWVNGVEQPQTVGTELGAGGPDILAIDPNGINAYGYQNSVSSYSTWAMAIDGNGIHQTQEVNDGPLSGAVGKIEEANGLLYDNLGNVYSVINNFASVGSFSTNGNFLVDPIPNKLLSVDQVGSAEFVLVYNLTTLQLIGSIPVTGIGTPSTSNLILVGADGLAFTTSNNQVVIIESQLVPEPSSFVMTLLAVVSLAFWCPPRRKAEFFARLRGSWRASK
jgi:hypothetical protein